MRMFNTRKAKAEHIEMLLGCLKPGELVPPQEIVARTGLSLTAVRGAIEELEASKQLATVRQNTTPKLRVGLPD